MILYHGSYLEISKPDLSHSRSNVDFIVNCRSGRDTSDYDLVVGGIGVFLPL